MNLKYEPASEPLRISVKWLFKVYPAGLGVGSFGFMVHGLPVRVWGLGLRVYGSDQDAKETSWGRKAQRVPTALERMFHGLNLRTTTSQKCAAVPRRARIQGSKTFVSLNSRLESNTEEDEKKECFTTALERMFPSQASSSS